EYEKALINFTEAKELLGEKANVADLLRVIEDLRRPRKAVDPPAPEPPPSAPPRGSRARSPRRVALRGEPPPPAPAPRAASLTTGGTLIVSTTPRGLLVQVDDDAVDLTPMRTKVKPGTHRVSLLDGDRKVLETTVDIKEGGTTTLVKDIPSERAPAPEPAPRETPPQARALAKTEELPRPDPAPVGSPPAPRPDRSR